MPKFIEVPMDDFLKTMQDAKRYRFLRDGEYPEGLLGKLIAAGIHKNEVDAEIDRARGE